MTANHVSCGSHNGYNRHQRMKEPPCDRCKKAEAAYRRERRGVVADEQAQALKASFEAAAGSGETEAVLQNVGRGEVARVEVPVMTDELEAALWNLKGLRAAMQVATARDYANLSRAHEELMIRIKEIEQLKAEEASPHISKLDEIRARRAEKLANRGVA